jgi:hypothetical protein
MHTLSKTTATVQPPKHPSGLTLAQYAEAKQLDPERLRASGLSDVTYQGHPAVRLAYLDPAGREVAARFRLRLDKGDGDDRFRWKKGAKAIPYGQNRLASARERGYVAAVEGESDAQTLWQYGEPALGIPGAGCWNEDRDAPLLDGIPIVYVVREPDAGGDSMVNNFVASAVRDSVRVVTLAPFKDPSEMHLDDPARFAERWEAAKCGAVPLS